MNLKERLAGLRGVHDSAETIDDVVLRRCQQELRDLRLTDVDSRHRAAAVVAIAVIPVRARLQQRQ